MADKRVPGGRTPQTATLGRPMNPGGVAPGAAPRPTMSAAVMPQRPGGGAVMDKLKAGGLGSGLGAGGMQAQRAEKLKAAGYTGPLPGSAELKAARKAGGTPIKDFRQANPGAMRPGGAGPRPTPAPRPNPPGGIVPPNMGGSPVPPRPAGASPLPPRRGLGIMAQNPIPPRPRLAEGGRVPGGRAGAPNPGKPMKPPMKPAGGSAAARRPIPKAKK